MFKRRIRGTVLLSIVVPLMLLISAASGVHAQDEASPASGNSPTVFVRQDPVLGTIFTDPNGRTLYRFTRTPRPTPAPAPTTVPPRGRPTP